MDSNLYWFFSVAWLGHLGLGLTLGVLGPVQPHLARQVGVDHKTISWMWSCRAFGVVLSCFLIGFVFNLKVFEKSSMKLASFAFGKIIVSFVSLILPFVTNFWMLLLAIFIQSISFGIFDIGDNSFVLESLGPKDSRPFVQSLHACVAIGFVLISVVTTLFIPSTDTTRLSLCEQLLNGNSSFESLWSNETVEIGNDRENSTLLLWPFLFISIHEMVVGLGFMILAYNNVTISKNQTNTFNQENTIEEKTNLKDSNCENMELNLQDPNSEDRNYFLILFGGFLFFVLSSGVDSYFQSQTYTFGLCGPLGLDLHWAGYLNTTYFMAYLIGRVLSIPLSKLFSPRLILFTSIISYLTIAILLSLWGGSSKGFLFSGTGLMGLTICFQFGCGLTWLAGKLKQMKSYHTSLMFIGGNVGWFVFPTVASLLFEYSGPESVFYLTFLLAFLHLVVFIIVEAFT